MSTRWILLFFLLNFPPVDGFAESQPLPLAKDTLELLRTNLLQFRGLEFDAVASRALIERFGGRILSATEQPDLPVLTNAIASQRSIEGGFLYQRIAQVQSSLNAEILTGATRWMGTVRPRGIILDLRFAEGTDYAAAARACEHFVEANQPILNWGEGLLVSTRRGDFFGIPLIVLANRETSAAAEAFVVALRQGGRAVVLGSKTAGKVGVFREFPLPAGSRLRLPVESVFSGDATPIAADGTSPDISMTIDTDKERDFLDRPFETNVTYNASSSLSTTGGTAARKKINEAELVRARHLGRSNDSITIPSSQSTRETLVIRDPLLARAIDLLRGLTALRP